VEAKLPAEELFWPDIPNQVRLVRSRGLKALLLTIELRGLAQRVYASARPVAGLPNVTMSHVVDLMWGVEGRAHHFTICLGGLAPTVQGSMQLGTNPGSRRRLAKPWITDNISQ
jgi:hypothetical protein